MHSFRRSMIIGLTTLIAVGAFSGSASAVRSIEVEPSGLPLISMTSSRLTFAGSVNVICDVTLSASLHRLIAKVAGALSGTISEGAARNCSNSFGQREPETAVTALFPMHMQYDSITGTLPNITGGTARVVGGFLIRTNIFGRIGCLYTGSIPLIAGENPTSRGRVGRNTTRLSRTLEGSCPSEGELQGNFTNSTPVETILLE